MHDYKVLDRIVYVDNKIYVLVKKHSESIWISSPEEDSESWSKMDSSYVERNQLSREWMGKPWRELSPGRIKSLAPKRECVGCRQLRKKFQK